VAPPAFSPLRAAGRHPADVACGPSRRAAAATAKTGGRARPRAGRPGVS